MRYMVVKANGTYDIHNVETLGMKEIQEVVAGPGQTSPFFEVVQGEGLSLYLNEEGKLIPLPVNVAITHFARANGIISSRDDVRGDVVVVGLPDDEGMDTDLPEDKAKAVLAYLP